MISNVVKLLDVAGDAAWECRSKQRAIIAARAVLRSGTPEEYAAALDVWRRAAGYDGPAAGLARYLADRYRDRGDIALSLIRAALMAEQAALSIPSRKET